VSVSLATGPHGRTTVLTVRSPLAAPGDAVVLQVWAGSRWLSLRARRLDGSDQAEFLLRHRVRGRLCRVVLLGTAAHGRSVSQPAVVP
jgi:hypothetical protein